MEWNFLSGAGAVFLGYYSLNLVLQILHGIRAFVLPALGIKKNLKKLGEWAGKNMYGALDCSKFSSIIFSCHCNLFRLFQDSLFIMHSIVA